MKFTGSFSDVMRPIGCVELTAERTFRFQGYETAAWWQEVTCQPQKVTVWSNGYMVSWAFEGVVTDDYFPTLWGGVPVGSRTSSARIGSPATHSFSPYAFMWATQYAAGEHVNNDMLFHLAPEYGVSSAMSGDKVVHFLTMANSHPLIVERDISAGTWDMHVYNWSWRGKDMTPFSVSRIEGFNGDTRQVAFRYAVNLLKEGEV